MYNYILSCFSNKHPSPFNEKFRKGYKNVWVNSIKDYTP